VLDPEDVPKYLNSPQTVLFDKSRLLYGLDKARRAIRDREEVVIVEGYLGVIVPYQHGFQNVVATMGTALTDEHLGKVKRYANRIILAMDSDAAGVKATLRGLDVARDTLDRKEELMVDARGWIRREARLQADIRVAVLPEGQDPDDVVNEDPEQLREILDQARPVVIHVMETLAGGRDLEDPKVKSAVAEQVVPLIEDVPSQIEREAYLQRLARRLEVDERTLLSYRTQKTSSRSSRVRSSRPAPPEPFQGKSSEAQRPHRKGESYEAHCVGILLREPELLYRVDRQLSKAGLNRLTEGDFQNADHQILIGLIRGALQQNDQEPRTYVVKNLSGEILSKADELLERTSGLNPKTDKVLEDLLRAFLNLRRWQVANSNSHLRYLLENDQANGDYQAGEYQSIIIENLQALNKIDKAIKLFTSRTAALH
jgi:DNA primase